MNYHADEVRTRISEKMREEEPPKKIAKNAKTHVAPCVCVCVC